MISTFTLSMEPDDYRSPRIGRRIKVHEHTGTIRYIGEVQDTRGIWLGIEWDDPARGKHSGQKDGRQLVSPFSIFSLRVAGTGSFIRPSPSISYGQSFLHALISKYVDLPHTTGHKETVILGSSNGAIEVEAVGLDKVRAKLARFERLREISLDVDEVAWADPLGDIKKACPNVRSLDLSNSLLPSWDMVALIAAELSALRALSLNCNRFSTLTDTKIMHASFLGLKELRVDQTMISWPEVITLTSVMPNIEYLEVGYNDMKILGGTAFQNYTSATKLKILNFDGNELEEWSDVMMSTASFTTCIFIHASILMISTNEWIRLYDSLERLILTSNRIRRIMLAEPKKAILNIKHIGLQDNLLSSWHDIDALNEWVPELQTLNISGNPLVSG
ncbi:hypothetical protein EW145_g3896 [Phellinidium pouzarii]|uniref:CAP-Gly domain-containing protein n=1 Tax=Phellinidium pouzarii TaxID=167371 RepID=A0A4S4L5Q6_9AGAM|nr:hypothetical protein EW145_g3896 [Phellinidium pouzarii]